MTTKSQSITTGNMSKPEMSLLLYLETRAVDHSGLVASESMNGADLVIAKLWDSRGFVRFGRVRSADFASTRCRHWCRLSDEAHEVAATLRMERARRSESALVVKYTKGA